MIGAVKKIVASLVVDEKPMSQVAKSDQLELSCVEILQSLNSIQQIKSELTVKNYSKEVERELKEK